MDGESSDTTIEQMLYLIDQKWELQETAPAERRFSTIYHVIVETGYRLASISGTLSGRFRRRELGVPADVRILIVLWNYTSIPVSDVIGIVDHHDDVPSPFYLIDSVAGRSLPYGNVGWVLDVVLRTVAG